MMDVFDRNSPPLILVSTPTAAAGRCLLLKLGKASFPDLEVFPCY
jgi:hypothetical protein